MAFTIRKGFEFVSVKEELKRLLKIAAPLATISAVQAHSVFLSFELTDFPSTATRTVTFHYIDRATQTPIVETVTSERQSIQPDGMSYTGVDTHIEKINAGTDLRFVPTISVAPLPVR